MTAAACAVLRVQQVSDLTLFHANRNARMTLRPVCNQCVNAAAV